MSARDPSSTLEEYRKKRDFGRSPEPAGGRERPGKEPRFVVQKHAASRLHYDFRLQVGGVLKSWAIPKGPSMNPSDKRLANPTEDHPLDYGEFEGVIPGGQYGAGTVLVWDTGTYRNRTEDHGRPLPIEQALERGHVSVWLEGSRLQGGFALTRFRTGKNEGWLLVKMNDEHADPRQDVLAAHPESALSGRSVEEVASRS
jgi:DNA ligase D-like protein (predicted 3'-phosphoesterase)